MNDLRNNNKTNVSKENDTYNRIIIINLTTSFKHFNKAIHLELDPLIILVQYLVPSSITDGCVFLKLKFINSNYHDFYE